MGNRNHFLGPHFSFTKVLVRSLIGSGNNQKCFFVAKHWKWFSQKWFPTFWKCAFPVKKNTISIWKWFFWNDLLPQKMISGCFWGKKMIYRCEKSFPSSSEMIFYTRKWFRRNSKMIFVKWFLEHFAPVLKMWFTLGKKTISCGNGHFRKWMEIIFFQKMLDNLRIFNRKWDFSEVPYFTLLGNFF